jgi:hypothetical protein
VRKLPAKQQLPRSQPEAGEPEWQAHVSHHGTVLLRDSAFHGRFERNLFLCSITWFMLLDGKCFGTIHNIILVPELYLFCPRDTSRCISRPVLCAILRNSILKIAERRTGSVRGLSSSAIVCRAEDGHVDDQQDGHRVLFAKTKHQES